MLRLSFLPPLSGLLQGSLLLSSVLLRLLSLRLLHLPGLLSLHPHLPLQHLRLPLQGLSVHLRSLWLLLLLLLRSQHPFLHFQLLFWLPLRLFLLLLHRLHNSLLHPLLLLRLSVLPLLLPGLLRKRSVLSVPLLLQFRLLSVQLLLSPELLLRLLYQHRLLPLPLLLLSLLLRLLLLLLLLLPWLLRHLLLLLLRLLLRSPFVVFGAMIMAFTIDVKSAWVFAVIIPLLFAVVFAIMFSCIPLYRRVQGRLDGVLGAAKENLAGVRVIRAFGKERQEVKSFEEKSGALLSSQLFVGKISALLNPVTYVMINLAVVVILNTGAVQIHLGNMQQGDVVALVNYMNQILIELVKLANLIIQVTKAMACAERVASVLNVEPEMEFSCPKNNAKNRKTGTSDEEVAFDHVSFTYGGAGAETLSNIHFTVKKGQTVGIIGGTGSGKSTLVNLLARFYDATDGQIRIGGHDIRSYSREELRGKIGMVMQKAQLFSGTIRSNLLWGNPGATDEMLWAALETAQAAEFVQKKEKQLDEPVEQGGRNLSGGQKQRLTIARALVSKPEILILDDSLSALDFATDAALRKAIGELEGNVTTFLVSQRISGIRQADKILVMEDGELAGQGTHEELMEICETYQEIYYSQFPEERPAAVKSSKETGKDLDKADKMTEKAEKGAAE